jgi:nitrous oxide reductase
MRKDNERSSKIDRRRLLSGAGLAIGAAGAAAATGTSTAEAASELQKPQQDGYRESEHVKTYYRLARF